MTEKQKIFADEYLIDLNATRAYRVAYPNCKKNSSADAAARKLLGNTRIKKYIDEKLQEIHDKKTADIKEVMEYLTSVLRGESESEEIVVEGVGDGCSKAKTMTKKPSEKDRLKAADLILKRFDRSDDGRKDALTKLDEVLKEIGGVI